MFDGTPANLLAIIAKGESEEVEFKSTLPPDAVLARHLSAFANTRGGILIVGVGDDGQPHGLPPQEAERTVERLRAVSTTVCDWSTRVGTVEIDGRKLAYLVVDTAPDHLAPAMTAAGEIYERHGQQTVLVGGTDRLRLVRKQGVTANPFAQNIKDSGRACILFVAMSFRTEQEPALVDYFNSMKRAVIRTGLNIEVRRVDLLEGDYEISQKLMSEIEKSDIVLADFTLNSANVYFELGFARGCRKRVIQTARKDSVLEFDVRQWRTLVYRNATELEEKLELELRVAHEEVTNPKPPLSVA
jgi:Putative DNA-binding domain